MELKSIEKEVFLFDAPGVAMTMYNIDHSIIGFARACFNYGLNLRLVSLSFY